MGNFPPDFRASAGSRNVKKKKILLGNNTLKPLPQFVQFLYHQRPGCFEAASRLMAAGKQNTGGAYRLSYLKIVECVPNHHNFILVQSGIFYQGNGIVHLGMCVMIVKPYNFLEQVQVDPLTDGFGEEVLLHGRKHKLPVLAFREVAQQIAALGVEAGSLNSIAIVIDKFHRHRIPFVFGKVEAGMCVIIPHRKGEYFFVLLLFEQGAVSLFQHPVHRCYTNFEVIEQGSVPVPDYGLYLFQVFDICMCQF